LLNRPVVCRTDASVRPEQNKIGINLGGAIIGGKNNKRILHSFASKLPQQIVHRMSSNIVDAELLAMLEGIMLCAKSGFKEVRLITDCQSAHAIMAGKQKVSQLEIAYLRKTIFSVIENSEMKVSFEWQPRSQNKIADKLASNRQVKRQECRIGVSTLTEYAAHIQIKAFVEHRLGLKVERYSGSRENYKGNVNGISLHRGVIHIHEDAHARDIMYAAGMLLAVPAHQRKRLTMAHRNTVVGANLTTLQDIATAWVWRVAKHHLSYRSHLVDQTAVAHLQAGRYCGLAHLHSFGNFLLFDENKERLTMPRKSHSQKLAMAVAA
jgi:ribonuclease HI